MDWETRFWDKVLIPSDESACWLWTAGGGADGYGRFWLDGRMVLAHRVAYALTVGPIPEDEGSASAIISDHVCRNRRCVNPSHIDLVTRAENTRRGDGGAWQRRKTHCKHGHEFTDENTIRRGVHRVCRACKTAYYKANA